MESDQNDNPIVDTIAYLESQGVPTDDEDDDDIHFCKKCKQVFKKLEAYLEHKVKHDKFKMSYNRAPGDRRMVIPTLKKKEVEKPAPDTSQGNNDTQSDAAAQPRKRRKKKRPAVDIELIAERNTYICNTCDRKFSREASLKWHIQYDHKTDLDSEEEEDREQTEEVNEEEGGDENYQMKEPPAKRVHVASDDDRPFKCDVCVMTFKEVSVLKMHMLTHSSARPFRCNYDNCPYAFKTKGSLVRHERRHTGERPYACEACGRSFAESGALTRHMRSRNPCTTKKDTDLPRYGTKWTYVPNIPAVVSQDKGNDDFVSMVPGEMVMVVTEGENGEQILTEAQVVSNNETVSSLDEGMMEEGEVTESEVVELVTASDHKSLTPTQCKVCREDCLEVEALRVHLRLHLADFPFHCGFCHFTTEDRQDLHDHLQSKHLQELKGVDASVLLPPTDNARKDGDQQTAKDNTEAQMAVSQLLELPMVENGDGGDTDTINARALSRCFICNRVFRGSSYLKQHMKSHTGDRPHECPVCHKSYITKDALNKHLIVHTDERNYKCGVCNKLFKRIAHVREHLKIHSAERPFRCTACDKSFKTNNALKVHLRTHSNCFPFECRTCHRHFREKGSMQRHLRTHTGERPFRCPRCGRGFAEHGTLNRHLKAKVQCDHYQRYQGADKEEVSVELEMKGEEETATDHGADMPTVLTEFSSVVADTQQYIVSDHLPEGDTQTTEYVVLHTDLATEDIQNVEIVTEGDIDPETILSTVAGSNSSYVVVNEAGNQLRIIDSSTGLTLATVPATSDQLSAVTVLPGSDVITQDSALHVEVGPEVMTHDSAISVEEGHNVITQESGMHVAVGREVITQGSGMHVVVGREVMTQHSGMSVEESQEVITQGSGIDVEEGHQVITQGSGIHVEEGQQVITQDSDVHVEVGREVMTHDTGMHVEEGHQVITQGSGVPVEVVTEVERDLATQSMVVMSGDSNTTTITVHTDTMGHTILNQQDGEHKLEESVALVSGPQAADTVTVLTESGAMIVEEGNKVDSASEIMSALQDTEIHFSETEGNM